ncbi:aspartyl/glutamyl-tRNA(Asn/Gln) amidotransferase subunit B [Candidatus Kryptonium thompsonii]|jgi:aspartyl-tRNA(Asn)/glutamyl-tRNA(Gln) amidotransferase subunit B|uniref:Aspartyl/glutamyl-tRNA(Asn/Gln) amidotransferase subunit B n=2 Tax=Candidatus Kryptonium thompsonii TaxID=1633631 RepID=A0A0P1MHC1_9BACT|nr:Asp-tRNA(Asn)/Glu-tRNA(Gln) amidotransferase subunit GatB [Candidatus Kryptonium thompsoni]CUS88131.1 aspartyl/glutamyl-tRNA(Asn/Gln) amidotransferase subunit B [Candidatus Kryptonium thompsoni]CUS90757.1 aspartyl/glutamyl-tRNA(Asn/Gln) amidotransferase subunit B [Candidatus Kryptonium thompsoni]CUS94785.1 aspartyl/glutamyl-tRNA(Asn/Gln) amidotransferase subunit B [Candidatus Kryptonium thompsoni]CUT03464.1 aspartyl/glutamyl-tRNA(Asn/Gln) amidotransferase subunit B [Candidatus Kryptonium tho
MFADKYEAVIGLEIHAQLLTNSKAFCGCSTKFGLPPNSNVCPICLGMPGTLPVLNKRVVEFAIKLGLATHCKIRTYSIFARKNYFYPDLPKGYQISQYEEPICYDGYVEIELKNGEKKKIRLRRIHMEEDAGKSIHDQDVDTLIDINRCGVPLLEIVTEPDINTPQEAALYLTKIRQLVQYLDICDGNMEEGSLRCDANVSVRLKGEKKLGTKTEVKNMNSIKNVEKALEYEINRQIQILESGGTVIQETLLWDAGAGVVRPMRSKEEAHDYRYFPEPDLVPVVVPEEWINEIKKSLPELPEEKRDRFMKQYKLPKYDAEVLTSSKALADYYEQCVKYIDDYKSVSNWIMVEVLKILNERQIDIADFKVKPEHLAMLINLVNEGKINQTTAKMVLEEISETGEEPDSLIERKGLLQISDESFIEEVVVKVLEGNKENVERYFAGKDKLFGYFVGEVMKLTKGKANPKIVNEVLKRKLEEMRVKVNG